MTNMKRSVSDSENDDLFDEDIKDGSPSQSCHVSDRKKRRGIIEKRRRDRINNSLTELRRLVPAAFEKQGSAKLEKAEILQMTVDHLKMLHSKGITGYNPATDYRSIGFRECVAEVSRYLVAVEGLDIRDPLRLRLLTHLQCYSAQLTTGSAWNHVTPPPDHVISAAAANHVVGAGHVVQYGTCPPPPGPASLTTPSAQNGAEQLTMTSHPVVTSPYTEASRLDGSGGHVTSGAGGHLTSCVGHVTSVTGGHVTSGVRHMTSGAAYGQFPVSLSPTGSHYMASSMTSIGQGSNSKPYRPWGAELAY